MKFKIRTEYTKDYFINVFKVEYRICFLIIMVLSIVVTLLSIFSFVLALLGNSSHKEDVVNLLQVIFLWVAYFTLPLICASVHMMKIRKKEIDGVRILSFDNQALLVNYEKYDKSVSYPINEIKIIRKIGNNYKLLINSKWMYISFDNFEIGNALDFYNWIENRIGC